MGTRRELIQPIIDFYETHGWCQGAFVTDAVGNYVTEYEDGYCFCVTGAMLVVSLTERQRKIVNAMFREETGFASPIFYNDTPGMTKEKLIETLEKMASNPAPTPVASNRR